MVALVRLAVFYPEVCTFAVVVVVVLVKRVLGEDDCCLTDAPPPFLRVFMLFIFRAEWSSTNDVTRF